ncbi:MAG: PDZ domain-containing protein [Ruminococcaceae bacterium]|nr:PDZ domain-containing protein [Oscillospiraceae bacterium]
MSENETPKEENIFEEPGEKLKRPPTVSVATCVAACVFVALAVFMATFLVLSQQYSLLLKKNGIEEGSPMNSAVMKLQQISSLLNREFLYEMDEEEMETALLKGYMYGLGDRYAEYFDKEEFAMLMDDTNARTQGIGINVTYNTEYNALQILAVFPDTPAYEAGVRPGDLITHIVNSEGETVSVAELGHTLSLTALQGEAGTVAKFTVHRGEDYSESVDFSIERGYITEYTVDYELYSADESIGIITISSFDAKTPEQFEKALSALKDEGVKGIIFDLRYNPGGELNSVCTVLDMLVGEGPVIRTVDKDGNEKVEYTSDKEETNIPMAVLMNGGTASAAELFSSCLKDYEKAVLVGEKTFGKGSMQTIRAFEDGTGFKYTYRYYCPPFSDNFDGVGVMPDVEAKLSEEAEKHFYTMSDEEDTQLAAAYEALNKK